MAQNPKRPSRPPDQRQSPRDVPKRPPKMIDTESGVTEQGEPIESIAPTPPVDRPAEEVIREKEREEYRYGGIPIGSDPRE